MPGHDCPKCHGTMAEGFIIDNSYGKRTVSEWIEGKPEASMWTGLKTGKRMQRDIATWRCEQCGFLESYAAG